MKKITLKLLSVSLASLECWKNFLNWLHLSLSDQLVRYQIISGL